MPTYGYYCEACDARFEKHRPVDHRHDVLCRCGRRAVLDWSQWSAPALHFYTPHFSKALGCTVASRRQERAICQQLGLENVGPARIDEVETEAEKHKRWNEERDANERPTQAFFDSWERAKAESRRKYGYDSDSEIAHGND